MTFTTEILLFVVLGFLILGPQSMKRLLARIARAKADFDNATRTFKNQVVAEMESASGRKSQIAGD